MSGPNPVCNCLLGYFGDNCEHCKFCNRYTNITLIISFGTIFKVFPFFQAACDTFNCQNNGSCVIHGGNATCLCHLSYTGEKCERSKNVKFNFVYYDNNVFFHDIPKDFLYLGIHSSTVTVGSHPRRVLALLLSAKVSRGSRRSSMYFLGPPMRSAI